MFQALRQFRDSSFLIDLTLSTEDGQHLHAHSPVLAAVSSLVHQKLLAFDDKMKRREQKDVDIQPKVSIRLGPEVGSEGLARVLEFAYTGSIVAMNRDDLAQIKVAAKSLGVSRVLDLCCEEEENIKKCDEKAKNKVSIDEQMKLSLQSIRQLWKERVGCNVELEVGGTVFHVHRVILAASSDYFRAMFTSGMRECQQLRVAFPFMEAAELEALIEQQIDEHVCLDVVSFAEAYGMLELLKIANDFVMRQFQIVASTPKFQDLPAEKLRKYLKSTSLHVTSELVVFKAVLAWIHACPIERIRLTEDLLKNVYFPLMTFTEFKEVKQAKLWTEHHMENLYLTILETFCSYNDAPRTLCRVYQPKDVLVLVGGDQISLDLSRRTPSRELWFVNSLRNYTGIVKNVEWKLLGEMPTSARLSHEVAVLAGKLYDPIQNSWERLADLQEKRCHFSMVVLKGMLYAIGGDTDPETNLDSVECYCPNTDTWSFAKPLDMTLSCHAATLWDGNIFISGGYHQRYQCLTSMFTYHPERGTINLAEMSQPRAYHCMETLHGHIYVAGGITLDENMTSIDHLACEVYDPVSDIWSAFRNLPIPHVGAASVVLEGVFYVLGGYCKENFTEYLAVEEQHNSADPLRMPPATDPKSHPPEHAGFQRGLETLFWEEGHNLEADRERKANIGMGKHTDLEDQFNREKNKEYVRLNNSETDLRGETCEEEDTFQELNQVSNECEYFGEQNGVIEGTDSMKVYSRDFYARDMFQALKQLRESSVLTDMTLSTEDGHHLHVHSCVLAAVSSCIHQRLPKWEREMLRDDVMVSISLGPEVGSEGLAGVLEFAYTGTITALNRDTLVQIKAAAKTLGVPRVLELCCKEEEKMNRVETKAEEMKFYPEEEMDISLQSIRQLWKERRGCDVELQVGRTSFYVHRVLLAASSDYFRAMFTSGMKESRQPCVHLPFLEAFELEALISCTYTGSLQLNWGCVFEISCTALRLQFQHILSMCLSFMEKEMHGHSCLDVASFAEAYGMQELHETANEFVLRHFQKVAATAKFQDLPTKKLRKYLKSPSLLVTSELVVFKAVAFWIEACPSKRLILTKELMKSVYFPLMTHNEFKEVKKAKLWTHCNTRRLDQTILDNRSKDIAPRTLFRVYQPKENLVLVGGDQISNDLSRQNPSRELWFGNSLRSYTGVVKNVEWRLLTEMPHPPRLSHDVAVLAEKLYVVGGQDYSGRLNVLNSVYR
ncbi:hypothetical protein DPEC_G00095410 [Dallia pectoralis]|uniref:Uncharacterized protein n=1 Tax=Dallia pectoralis TaxID=75939 RepID=A0ACC2GVY5_DALPE|nr:hypothetical protein DPEC_G00095410 [Dallia pectoralis]